jgi:hypothetical protein
MGRKTPPCELPGTPTFEAIQKVTMKDESEHARSRISEYVEWQVNKGADTQYEVMHAERIKAETVFGQEHVAWDVHTNEPGRWWVITGPTNLYSQKEFPSLDYTLSFHVGVTARVGARDAKRAPSSRRDRLRIPWRRWETAAAAIDLANEAEDFQAVGMRCRETLVSLGKALQKDFTLPESVDPPKAADFVSWASHAADHYAKGARTERIRGYMKAMSKETWQLVNWLTHTSKANLYEAQLALDATSNLLATYSAVVMNSEAAPPKTCPVCGSYRIESVYEPEIGREPLYVNVCESCEWNDVDEAPAAVVAN